MDNELHLERFAEDREGWIAANPEVGVKIMHPHLYRPILKRLEAENNISAYWYIDQDTYAYFIGRRSRSELLEPRSEAEKELQQLIVDEIDFSNDIMNYKFENGRWVWPEGSIEKMLQKTAKELDIPLEEVYKNLEHGMNIKRDGKQS